MSRLLFIQNGETDAPGLFATVAAERGTALDILHAWDGEPVPTVANGWAGIAIGGGAMSAYQQEEFPFLRDEEALIRAARAAGRPLFGMCLGAQLIAGACGGKVFANKAKEIGFQEVRFRPEAETDPLWHGYTTPLRPVQWHGDTFSLPTGATLLASSELTENQLCRLDDLHYGLQFHLEIDVPVLTAMIEEDPGCLAPHGVDAGEFLRTAQTAIPKVEPGARSIFNRWLDRLPV